MTRPVAVTPLSSNRAAAPGLWANYREAQTALATASTALSSARPTVVEEMGLYPDPDTSFAKAHDEVSIASRNLTAATRVLAAFYGGHGPDAQDAFQAYLIADAAYIAGIHLAAVASVIGQPGSAAPITQLREELDDARHALSLLTSTNVS